MIISIQPVSSRSKIETLREFGHRVFVELGDDGKPIGYFVQRRIDAQDEASKIARKRTRSSRPIITANQALIYTAKRKSFQEGSLLDIIQNTVSHLAAKPVKRGILEGVILAEHPDFNKHQVTGTISRLIDHKVLEVPGDIT